MKTTLLFLVLSFCYCSIHAQNNSPLWNYLNDNLYNSNMRGNVGIGTATPTERFTVVGNIKSHALMTEGIVIGSQTAELAYPFAKETIGVGNPTFSLRLQSPNNIYFHTGIGMEKDSVAMNNVSMSILGNGYIGIGTLNPERILHIQGDGGLSDDVVIESNSDTQEGGLVFFRSRGTQLSRSKVLSNNRLGFISFRGFDGSTMRFASQIEGYSDSNFDSSETVRGNLRFKTAFDGVLTERLRIQANGFIGIGTTDPKVRLQIIDSDISLANNSGGGIMLGSLDGRNVVIDQNEMMARDNGEIATLTLQAEGGDFNIHGVKKGGTEFAFKNNGKVGIGTLNPDYQLHLKGDGFIKLEQNGSSSWGELNVTSGGTLRLFRHSGSSRKGIDITGSSVTSTTSFLTHQGTDFRLGTNDGRPRGSKTSQRALVHNNGGVGGRTDALHINYNGDFEGGVRIQGSHRVKIDGYIYANARNIGDHRNVQYNTSTDEFGWDNSSRKDKRNIKSLEQDFRRLLKADPKTYTREWDESRWEIGFIAEDFHDLGLYPLVEYDEDGYPDGIKYDKAILYVVPILKEQQKELEHKQKQINQLEERLTKLEAIINKKSGVEKPFVLNPNTKLKNTQLLQNQPNSFSESTSIQYFISGEIAQAVLQITTLEGRIIKQITIQDRGEGQLTLEASTLSAGTYWYSLILDGKLIETKQMILTK